jgi:cold shock CspA family protein/ribosome-associated translation inhibitor RaiA
MEVPLQIVFEDMDPSEFVEARIREEVDKLEQFHDRITSCRVVVSEPHRHKAKGKLFHVRVFLTVPGGGDVVIDGNKHDKHAHEDVYVAIRDAFGAARRRLQDHSRKRAGKVKAHEEPPHGHVVRLFADDGYGFIEAADGREFYFHRNSVLNDGFDKLEIGAEVRFAEEMGDKGPQASTVTPIGKHHLV